MELVGGSKRINELTGELALAKDDLRQAEERLEASATTIEHHKHTIHTMQTAHHQAEQTLHAQLKEQFQNELNAQRAQLEEHLHSLSEVRLDEQRKAYETERAALMGKLNDATSNYASFQSEHAQQIEHLSTIEHARDEAATRAHELADNIKRFEHDRDEALKLQRESEQLMDELRLENDTLKTNLERMASLEAQWTAERQSMKQAFTEQYALLEQKVQPTEVPTAPLVDVSEVSTEYSVDDYPIEYMRKEFASINTHLCDIIDQENDGSNMSLGVCGEATAARKAHPLRDVATHNVMFHSGGGLNALDAKTRQQRCNELDAHTSIGVGGIGESPKGPAANYLHSNMLDIADWIKRQKNDRASTRMVSVGY